MFMTYGLYGPDYHPMPDPVRWIKQSVIRLDVTQEKGFLRARARLPSLIDVRGYIWGLQHNGAAHLHRSTCPQGKRLLHSYLDLALTTPSSLVSYSQPQQFVQLIVIHFCLLIRRIMHLAVFFFLVHISVSYGKCRTVKTMVSFFALNLISGVYFDILALTIGKMFVTKSYRVQHDIGHEVVWKSFLAAPSLVHCKT